MLQGPVTHTPHFLPPTSHQLPLGPPCGSAASLVCPPGRQGMEQVFPGVVTQLISAALPPTPPCPMRSRRMHSWLVCPKETQNPLGPMGSSGVAPRKKDLHEGQLEPLCAAHPGTSPQPREAHLGYRQGLCPWWSAFGGFQFYA